MSCMRVSTIEYEGLVEKPHEGLIRPSKSVRHIRSCTRMFATEQGLDKQPDDGVGEEHHVAVGDRDTQP